MPLASALVFSAATSPARAQSARSAVAPAGGGQLALGVGFDDKGALRAASCAAAPCTLQSGITLDFPAALRGAVDKGSLAVVGIGESRRAIVVSVPDDAHNQKWQALIVAPLAAGPPKVLFSGFTGLTEGQEGGRQGSMLTISEPDADGARSILVGKQYEELMLCGRPAILAPEVLHSKDLSLRPAKVQRLSAAERDQARKITAIRIETSEAAPLLRASGASSAVGAPSALTDGDLNTTWSENRGGAGRGEFVVLNAPAELPITGLEFVIRPPEKVIAQGAAPERFFFANSREVVEVTMPEDAWKFPGARYLVSLSPALQGDCLALVTDSAFDESTKAQVTFAELAARTEFGAANVSTLVGALAGGGQRAEAAKAVLRTMGPPAFEAVAGAYGKLDEGGRRVALEVIDHAPCPTSAPVYVDAFRSQYEAHRAHARDRLRRCGKDAAEPLSLALKSSKGPALLELAGELALIAPERAIVELLARLDERDVEGRRGLRKALARAVASPAATEATRSALRDPKLSPVATLDLLRALGTRAAEFEPEAGAALERLLGPGALFRTRFLALGPLGTLALKNTKARELFVQALRTDPDPHVRAEAARVAQDPLALERELLGSLADDDVRVREAAANTLGGARAVFAGPTLVERLSSDKWPIVRQAAAKALGGLGPNPSYDDALARALGDDESPRVQQSVLAALGSRQALRHAEIVRERLNDDQAPPETRAAAARALGEMCDASAVSALNDYALKLADRFAGPEVQTLGLASLSALGRLAPADLAKRLAPLLAKGAPPPVVRAARGALSQPRTCRKR